MKKPNDKNIRIIKTIFALLYIISIAYAFWGLPGELNLNFFGNDLSTYKLYVGIVFMLFGVPTLVSGIFDKNLLKSKHSRIMQAVFGIFMIYICGRVIPTQDGLLDITILLTLMGWFYLFASALGKLVTKQGKRQGEKVTKVRV